MARDGYMTSTVGVYYNISYIRKPNMLGKN